MKEEKKQKVLTIKSKHYFYKKLPDYIEIALKEDTNQVVLNVDYAYVNEQEVHLEFHPETDLTVIDYNEIIQVLLDSIYVDDKMIFFTTPKANGELEQSLISLRFEEDKTNASNLCYEKPVTQWGPIYMLFGLSIGMSMGIANGNQSIGMCLGMSIGLLLGTALTSNETKQRETIRTKRNGEKKDA